LLIAELGHRVTGVDLSEGMLAKAREKAAQLGAGIVPPRFEMGDAIDPPGTPASVDVVISRHVLWTLHDPVRAIQNWRRLLRPGGRILAIDGLWQLSTHQPTVRASNAGTSAGAAAVDAPAPWRTAWNKHYGAVRSSLPLFATEAFEPSLAVFRGAGFPDAELTRLSAIEDVEAASTPDRAPGTPRFVITARV
jgi:SAM-dependent methyltransferase